MPILRFDHYAIRTTRFVQCLAFYCDILDLTVGPRPPLAVEGVWLYNEKAALVHIVDLHASGLAGTPEPELLRGRRAGLVDHVAFRASGLEEMRERLRQHRVGFREAAIPSLNVQQLFIEDPDGVVIELDYSV
jgi:catechol 2,3-dioxygenase-like lactoylglutathione lyase family enzyme